VAEDELVEVDLHVLRREASWTEQTG
jgi:hypothetical protein